MASDITTVRVSALSKVDMMVYGDEALNTWRESLRQHVPGAEHTTLFKRRHWDGTWVPGKWCRQVGTAFEMRCSRGHLNRLEQSFDVTEVERIVLTITPEELKQVGEVLSRFPNLRDYQKLAVIRALSSRWGRVALATNAGKGGVIAIIALLLRERGIRTLILCDEVEIFQALWDETAKWLGGPPAKVEGGGKNMPQDLVVLAMVPTLNRRVKDHAEWRDWVGTFGCVLLDEADKALADSWRRVLSCATGTDYRVGFSGTFPEDDYSDLILEELMGPILVRTKNLELINRGISAKPQVELIAYDATFSSQNGRPKAYDWWHTMDGAMRRRWIYENVIVYNQDRHNFLAGLIRENTPTCVIVNRVDHGHQLQLTIPGSVFMSGAASKKERTRILEAFQRGEFHVLIVTKILDRGSNRLGHAMDLIFASGEGSIRQNLQRIGRGLRRAGGKEFLRLVDVIDVVTDNGKKKKRGDDYLHRAARERLQLYVDEGFEARVVEGPPKGIAPSGYIPT